MDEQVLDSVGEITNMIVGGFKNLLEARVGSLQMSIPSVIHGKNISMRDSKADVSVAVRCAFRGGRVRTEGPPGGGPGVGRVPVSISKERLETCALDLILL